MTGISNIPNGPHWAIVSTVQVTIPGDERSRTHPGHGYPERTETFITYQAFTAKGEWERAVETLALSRSSPPFRALKVDVADIKLRVTLGNDE